MDIVSNANHDKFMNSSRDLYLALYFFGYSVGGTDQNVEQLKSNVDILMANQNAQQEHIREIFKLKKPD